MSIRERIKTPISIMQMILKSDDTDTNRELLAELFRIEQYSEMALNYLRLNSSSSDFVIRKYNLDNIIKQAVHRYAPQFIRRKIKLIYSAVDAEIITDEKWLLFIIEQILSNAIKYTLKGYVEIKYSDEVLTITDTGIGIPEEDIPRIFEKGFTGLGGRKYKKATGLGLYLCKKSADKLGHKISIKSDVGKGTEVSIDFNIKYFDIE
ncbi:MAG: sensor histidine kinase, partial [Oscillospiraceae bacterium]|nr:sensor histidine kinase [Oscillospiraceae bacterium]